MLHASEGSFHWFKPSAITVHKSQGETYLSVVYEYNKTHPQKLVYVALSHCTNVNNLYLTNAKGDHHSHHKDSNVDKGMLSEYQRLEQHRLPTLTQWYLRALRDVDSSTEFTLVLLNVQSLNAHADDIERDSILTTADILCFTETWNARKPFINGFVPIVCTAEAECPAGGVGIYVKLPETAVNLDLPLTSQSHNGEHAAVKLSNGIVLMTLYLAPNHSKGNIMKYINIVLRDYETTYKNAPFVLAGDFNVNNIDDTWLIQHMASRYALRCISFDHLHPMTIRGTCIDIIAKFRLHPIQELLTLHFTDHKAVIMKGQLKLRLTTIYGDDK